MRSLFVKIFLWFWLATSLSGVALFLIGLATHPGPSAEERRRLSEQWRRMTGPALALYGQTAAELLERDGLTAVEEYTRRLEQTTGIRIVLLMRRTDIILDREAPEGARSLAARAAKSGSVEGDLADDPPVIATRILGPRGVPYALAATPAGPPPPRGGPPPPPPGPRGGLLVEIGRFARGFSLPLLVTFVVGGLVCLGLAWRLTAPVRRLRSAAQRLAGGDLTARVGAGPVQRGDEIAALARDFDLMAAQIEELMTAQRQLLRDISHELRSPLARQKVALELARQRSGPEAVGALDRIDREAERLNDLIGQLLTLTQIETGAGRIARGPVSLTRLIQAIASDANFEAETRRRRVRAVVEEDLAILGSEEMLRRAIENVVRNAVRYTPEDTQVDILLSRRCGQPRGDAAVICIRDHGPGVPEAALSHLFLPFYRVADARDRQTGGTGIGLAITERAVRLHNGTVTAANAPDGGLIVEILLPVAAACEGRPGLDNSRGNS
jgi:two-component system sensor histidine kinase CpxA